MHRQHRIAQAMIILRRHKHPLKGVANYNPAQANLLQIDCLAASASFLRDTVATFNTNTANNQNRFIQKAAFHSMQSLDLNFSLAIGFHPKLKKSSKCIWMYEITTNYVQACFVWLFVMFYKIKAPGIEAGEIKLSHVFLTPKKRFWQKQALCFIFLFPLKIDEKYQVGSVSH